MRGDADQLSTARLIVAQFQAQIDEFEGMNRASRRTPRGRDLAARMEGLRVGLRTWTQRVSDIGRANEHGSNS